MKAVFLGTGTSVGIPMIGCFCPVCTSTNPKNRRRRTSLYLEAEGTHLIVDTPPEFREQALEYKIPRVDAVLFTHSHADHIFGFDDIRRFNTIQDSVIPAYAHPSTLSDLRRIFSYIGNEKVAGHYRPRIDFCEITSKITIGPFRITPLPVIHDDYPALGFLFEAPGHSLAFIPDCRELPDALVSDLAGIDVMVLDALRHSPHRTHMTLEESVATLKRIKARQSFIIHMCHDLEHEATERILPQDIGVSYDGMIMNQR